MSIEQLTLSLADRIRKVSSKVNLADELSLLYVWKYLIDQYPDLDLPTMFSVIQGERSLVGAYALLNDRLKDKIEYFARAKLPDVLSEKDVRYILREIAHLTNVGNKDYMDQLVILAEQEGQGGVHQVLPHELIDLMIALSTFKEGEVYVPFTESMQLAVGAAFWGAKVVFEAEHNSALVDAAAMMANLESNNSDPLYFPSTIEGGGLKSFPNVMMVLPFGRRIKGKVPDQFHRFSESNTNSDVLALEHALAQCSGRLVALVPQGFLFRGANDYDLRARLVDSGWLEAVIQLPSPLLSFTGIATTVLVIDRKRKPDRPVLFYDANQQGMVKSGRRGKPRILKGWEQVVDEVLNRRESANGKEVSAEEIRENRCDLSVSRYVLGAGTAQIRRLGDTRPLSSVAELIRGQLLKEEDAPTGTSYLEVGVKDIGFDGVIAEPKKHLRLSGRMKDRAELQRLQPGDILLATKGSVGRVGLVGAECGDNWVASQSFQVIRLSSSNYIAKQEILFRFLSSPMVQAYLAEQITGTTIPVVKTADIKELPIPQLPLDEQHKIMQTHKAIGEYYTKMQEIQQKIAKLEGRHWSLRE